MIGGRRGQKEVEEEEEEQEEEEEDEEEEGQACRKRRKLDNLRFELRFEGSYFGGGTEGWDMDPLKH